MYDPSGPSCMRWNIREFLKIKFIGVSSWQRSVSGEHRLCRANLHRHLDGRAHPRLTRDSPEDGIVSESVPSNVLCDPDPCRRRTDNASHDALPPIWFLPTHSRASEHPIIGGPITGVLAPCMQRLGQTRIEWNGFL